MVLDATSKERYGNAILVTPNDDILIRYTWLKSSDRDGQMGAASATNRKTLILAAGIYTLTSLLTLDTDYVDIFALGNVLVTRAGGGATVTQTANDVRLEGFTIRNSGSSDGDHGFVINISSGTNSASIYRLMEFRQPNAIGGSGTDICPVRFASDDHGLWEYCVGDDFSWRCDDNVDMASTMYQCRAGVHSYGGDASGASVSGSFYFCIGGAKCFGGCGGFGCDCTSDSYFFNCVAGEKSFATGKEFAGTAINCKAGLHSFAGYNYGGSNYPTFSGVCRNCITDGGYSFAQGHASNVFSGIIENCINGSPGESVQGLLFLASALFTWTDNKAKATLATSFGDDKDITYTNRDFGIRGNITNIKYETTGIGTAITVALSTRAIKVRHSASITANEVVAALEANSDAMKLVSVVAAPGDGTGDIPDMDWTYLSGGIDPPFISGSHPPVSTKCTDATVTVFPFDNGHTYTNEGVGGSAVHFDLPPALRGMRYAFCRVDYAAGEDIEVDPNGTEHIYQLDGTDSGAGDYYGSDKGTDAFWRLVLECFKDGEWRATEEVGTFETEA